MTNEQRIIQQLIEALEPFANCVFYDNGDATVSAYRVKHDDFINAYFTYHRANGGAA